MKEDEERKLVKVSPDYFKPILITALHSGMRKNEILNLRWFDVDFDLGQITVRETKGGKVRYLPLNRTLTETLQEVKIRSNSKYVFSKRDGSPYRDVRKPFEKALRRAGMSKIRFHDLRHTFASKLVMIGENLVTIKELLGYQSILMTLSQKQRKK